MKLEKMDFGLKTGFWLVVATYLLCAGLHGAEVARWVFDKSGSSGISSTNGKFIARIGSKSGNSGIKTEDGRTFLHIDGNSPGDCVTLSGKPSRFRLRDKFSLEAWFRPNFSKDGGYAMIVGGRYTQFQLDWAAAGTVEFFVGGGDLVKNRVICEHLSSGDWLHVVATYDAAGSGPNQCLYVNGKLAGSIRNDSAPISDEIPVRLAQNGDLSMVGGIDADWREVALYDHALSQAEVERLFEEGREKPTKISANAWTLPLEPQLWKEPGSFGKAERYVDTLSGRIERSDAVDRREFATSFGNGALRMRVEGDPPERSGGSLVRRFSSGLDLSGFNYCLITCRAIGLQRDLSPLDAVALSGGGERIALLRFDEIICDGIERSYAIPCKITVPIFSAELSIYTRNSFAELSVSSVRLVKELPADCGGKLFSRGWGEVQNVDAFKTVDLSGLFNGSLAGLLERNLSRKEAVISPASAFPGEKFSAFGIPFVSGRPGNELVTPADSAAAENGKTVQVLGLKASRGAFRPAGRDDVTAIDVNAAVSELFLVFADDKPGARSRRPYGIPARPWVIDAIEGIAVELEYDDDSRETCFPYSLQAQGYSIQGMTGVYGVPADISKRLKKILLHNKIGGISVSLAALTANLSDHAILPPSLSAEPELVSVPAPPSISPSDPSLKVRGGIVEISNAFYRFEFDCRNGFSVRSVANHCSPGNAISFAPSSGLEVVSDAQTLSGSDFKTVSVSARGSSVEIGLKSKVAAVPLALKIVLRADSGPQLAIDIEAGTFGAQNLSAGIRCPCFKDLSIAGVQDTWGFFPQYRNVLSDQPFFCKQPNHRGFLMQFMDAFNPRVGSGIAFLTRNLEQEPVQYCMSKSADGVSGYIESEGEDFVLEPGKPLRLCQRVVAVHGGDWHQAAGIYADWVASWYKPFRSQDKDWFQRAFFVKTYCCSLKDAERIGHIARPVVDPVSKEFAMDDLLAAEERYMGMKPQLAHFYNWAFLDKTGEPAWGDYSTREYANFGGLEKFQELLRHTERDKGVPVSLYTIWDRYSAGSGAHGKFGDTIASVRKGGQALVSPEEIHVSVGVAAWREHAVANLARLARETGTNALYLDVFATDDRARSFASGRGHANPSRVSYDDTVFLKAVREAVPSDVALWGEFPIADAGSQYWDGFINYSPLFLHEHLATTLNAGERAPLDSDSTMLPPDFFRFLFPKLRNVCFPVGNEGYIDGWRCLKFVLFNGLSLYDTTWRLYPGQCLENVSRSLKIMTDYPDCFTSERPEMFVPALRGKVYANRFPGENRVVWTLFNSRYRSVKGKIIAVDHKDGSRYLDLWRGQVLEPELSGGKAIISLEMEPQQIGCIARIDE